MTRERALRRARLSLACADAGMTGYTMPVLARMSLVALDALWEVIEPRLKDIEAANRKTEAATRRRRT